MIYTTCSAPIDLILSGFKYYALAFKLIIWYNVIVFSI